MKVKFIFILIFVVITSCTKSKNTINDFKEDELYEVQGIITKLKRTSSSFDSPRMKVMNYIYHLDYDVPLEGVEKNYNLTAPVGTPIVVVASRKDPKISFFSHIGRIDERLRIGDEVKEYDSITKDGVKRIKIE